ncbi:hypothetical protein R5W24_006231 [Gemmata sp. JC717]|uniref:protein kinase domain-containing protein n=1 Tax=Gemmata algarum TaxID=2975278 RepID=UPI0021BACDC8|nr:hypothetical protein [Gemmata algarum]MDY3557047.1 hypothetical protein [Gemmata algarum]
MALAPANAKDAATLADELVRCRVVDLDQLAALVAEFPGGTAAALVEFLAARGALTPFQASRVRAGESAVLALGPYRLTGPAGRGTFGPLFAATHVAHPGRFALRVTPLRSLWRARQAKQLARALSAGPIHPAVLPLVEVDSANGFHYLVWPHADGIGLAELVEGNGPLAPGDAIALLGHLANALAACHARGVTHGALTPDCVRLAEDGLPRLLELGAGALLAQSLEADEALLDSLSAAFAAAGVLSFGAPELALNPLSAAPACDQYALAAVGYFALTGLAPYPHPTLAEQFRAKRSEAPPSVAVVNTSVPHDLAAVLERMMHPDPAARFASLAEVEEQLSALAPPSDPSASDQIELESLLLSRLQKGGAGSGAISWTESGSGVLRPAARDDSDASVTFDLPEAPETVPGPLPLAHECADTPRNAPGSARAAERSLAVPSPVPQVPSEGPVMGNRLLGAMNDGSRERRALPPPPDPRLSAPTPVQWHTADEEPGAAGARRAAPPPGEPPASSAMWKTLRRNVLFWKAPRDAVQVTVFGPSAAPPGQTVRLTIFLHPPDAVASVRTLSRAFQGDAEQVGTGYLAREVARGAELAVHVSVANAGVGKALMKCQWRGQPHRLSLDLHVPWESAEGWTPGLVSVGLDDVRVGKVEFWLNVLPRKA